MNDDGKHRRRSGVLREISLALDERTHSEGITPRGTVDRCGHRRVVRSKISDGQMALFEAWNRGQKPSTKRNWSSTIPSHPLRRDPIRSLGSYRRNCPCPSPSSGRRIRSRRCSGQTCPPQKQYPVGQPSGEHRDSKSLGTHVASQQLGLRARGSLEQILYCVKISIPNHVRSESGPSRSPILPLPARGRDTFTPPLARLFRPSRPHQRVCREKSGSTNPTGRLEHGSSARRSIATRTGTPRPMASTVARAGSGIEPSSTAKTNSWSDVGMSTSGNDDRCEVSQ